MSPSSAGRRSCAPTPPPPGGKRAQHSQPNHGASRAPQHTAMLDAARWLQQPGHPATPTWPPRSPKSIPSPTEQLLRSGWRAERSALPPPAQQPPTTHYPPEPAAAGRRRLRCDMHSAWPCPFNRPAVRERYRSLRWGSFGFLHAHLSRFPRALLHCTPVRPAFLNQTATPRGAAVLLLD